MAREKALSRPIRLLYLEDNLKDAELANRALQADGLTFQTTHVRSKEEFQAMLSHGGFDLIISDFTLPTFDGMAALELAKQALPDTPFLFLSGTIGEARAVESLKSGAVDYVLKEHLGRLGAAVRRALREADERTWRREAELGLQAAQKRLTNVLAKSPAIIYVLSIQGSRIQPEWVSENILPLLGYTVEEACRPDWWFNRVHPDDRAASGALVLGSGREQGATEYRFRHQDGHYRWIRDEQRLLQDPSGRPAEIVGSWMDITERKILEEQLRQAQKMEAIGQLAGGVAHDFNNMLAVIQGNSELALMMAEQLDLATVECLRQISAASERAAGLTRQLLAFSRKQVMQSRPVELNSLVANLTKMLGRIIGESVVLECQYGNRIPLIQADAGMLEQLLINLVLNARDAMPRGGKLRITTQPISLDPTYARTHPEARVGEFVCLSVQDAGVGIAPEHLPRIFEPFFTTKEPGKGTGLGLATVYGIVKQHQGWAEVVSRLGDGTTFHIFLPVPSVAPGVLEDGRSEAKLKGGTETILLVEDELAVRLVTRRLLESFGYKVLEAGTAQVALEMLAVQSPNIDLLITDIVLPEGMTGRELAQQVRHQKPDLKCIFISGYSADIAGRDTQFFRRTNSWFIQKPCASRGLIEMVRRCLDGQSPHEP